MQDKEINKKNHCDSLLRFFNNKKNVTMVLAPSGKKTSNLQTHRPTEWLNCEKTDDSSYIASFQSKDDKQEHSNKNIKTSIAFKDLDEYKKSIVIRGLSQYTQASEHDVLSLTEEGDAYVYFSYY